MVGPYKNSGQEKSFCLILWTLRVIVAGQFRFIGCKGCVMVMKKEHNIDVSTSAWVLRKVLFAPFINVYQNLTQAWIYTWRYSERPWLAVHQLQNSVKLLLLVYNFKCLNGMGPDYLVTMFKFANYNHLIYLTEPWVHTQYMEKDLFRKSAQNCGMSCHLKLRIVRYWALLKCVWKLFFSNALIISK